MSEHPADTLSLVADVGGTNTRVALANGAELLTDTVRKYKNADYAGLGAVLKTYLSDEPVDCAGAAVAIAGPVRDGRGTLTNLDWSVDPEMLAQVTRAETVAVLNDLQAQGRDIIHLEIGQPDFATPEPITNAAMEAVKANKTHYTSAAGLPELRQLIADDYAKRFDCNVRPDQIFITPGGSGAIPLILGYLLGPGKRLMIGDPTYPCNRNLTQVFHG